MRSIRAANPEKSAAPAEAGPDLLPRMVAELRRLTIMIDIGNGGTVSRVWRQPARRICARSANESPNRRPGCRRSRLTAALPALGSIKKLASKERKALKKPKS